MTEILLNELEVAELTALIRSREITATELVDACLAAVERHQPTSNAFVALDAGKVRAEALALDEMASNGLLAGPLHGIPVAVKDNYWTLDYPTTACSEVHPASPNGLDATAVSRLRSAGAIVFGKTNMHEWAYGATNEVSLFGPTRNPWNSDHITGGSSGGSGAALAARMIPAALGSDTGGSVRIPAAACGVCGLKPTYGRVNSFGVLPLSWSLDCAGPMARSARDLRVLFDVLVDDGSSGRAVNGKTSVCSPENLRVAVLRGDGIFCDNDVGRAFEGVLNSISTLGCKIEDVELDCIREGFDIWKVIMFAEASTYHARFLESEENAEKYSDNTRMLLEAGRSITATDYLKAQQYRSRFIGKFNAIFEKFDAICLPTLPLAAPKIGETDLSFADFDISTQDAMTAMPFIANMTGLPAIAFPSGVSESGLPVSATLMGAPFGENIIMNVAEAFQAITKWHEMKAGNARF